MEILLIFPNFRRSLSSAICEATCIYQFLTNNHPSFHLWRKENLLNHQKVLKCYEHGCRIQRAINESVKHRYDSEGNVMNLATH